jgi:Rieske Fe-S protein
VPEFTRRDALLLTAGIGTGGVLASAIWATVADPDGQPDATTANALPPSSTPATSAASPRQLATVEQIPDGGALDVSAAAGEPAYLTRNGDSVRAVSATCTHANCVIAWLPNDRRFECPCHRGTYDVDGAVVSGPPPRALEELSIVIDNGTVFLEQ